MIKYKVNLMKKEETFEANCLCLTAEDINLSSFQTVNTMTAVPFISLLVQLKAVNDFFMIFAEVLLNFTLHHLHFIIRHCSDKNRIPCMVTTNTYNRTTHLCSREKDVL